MAGVIAGCLVLLPHAAGADPIADKKAEASRLASQISALGDKESALAERYNEAKLNAQVVEGKVSDAKAKLAQATADTTAARARLSSVAVDAYVKGSTPSPGAQIDAKGDPSVATVYTDVVSSGEVDALDALRATTQQLHEQQAALSATQQQAKSAVQAIEDRRSEVVKAGAAVQATLGRVTGQLADLVAEAQAARRAADAARAAALARTAAAQRASRSRLAAAVPTTSESSGGSVSGSSGISAGSAPATRSGAAAAVSAALRQVGQPYQWGAAGPGSFDCSGLTLWAWRAAGVSLPHYTGAQYAATTHISLSDLQPGDLVYNRSMGHMGMYIGNGNMVEAPHTGADVRVVPLRSDMVLASRP